MELNKSYWANRYDNQQTGWDIGEASQPLQSYFDQISKKDIKTLVPGAGNGHEVAYLHKKGFTNIYLLDWAEQPIENFKKKIPTFPTDHLICKDFFEFGDMYFDLIIEQTFFCALETKLRRNYVEKMKNLLMPGGLLVGLWFDIQLDMDSKTPPFGGDAEIYKSLFEKSFNIIKMEKCHNSIKPRMGNELFCVFQRKD